jgi:uncharacterized protein YciW
MLRRLAGEPIKGENYSRAKIEAAGWDQNRCNQSASLTSEVARASRPCNHAEAALATLKGGWISKSVPEMCAATQNEGTRLR